MVPKPETLLRDLIALPSVNPAFLQAGDARAGEWRVREFLASRAAKAGLPIEAQPVFEGDTIRTNLVVRLQTSSKPRHRIILAPHLDTVGADDFTPRVVKGRLFGRGACDTKGSVAAMFTALLAMAESGTRPAETEIIFAGLMDVGNGQEGSGAFAKLEIKRDRAMNGE